MDYPLQTVGSNKKEEPINGVSQVDVISDVNTRDRVALARLGKRQVLNVRSRQNNASLNDTSYLPKHLYSATLASYL